VRLVVAPASRVTPNIIKKSSFSGAGGVMKTNGGSFLAVSRWKNGVHMAVEKSGESQSMALRRLRHKPGALGARATNITGKRARFSWRDAACWLNIFYRNFYHLFCSLGWRGRQSNGARGGVGGGEANAWE